jgi:SRSO17 transposase
LQLIDRAKANGIQVMAWTADEFYGQDTNFLDSLDARGEAFVVEIKPNTRVWLAKPKVLKSPRQCRVRHIGRARTLRKRDAKPREVQNLARYSPAFTDQNPQRYRIQKTHKGSEVWEIRWSCCWRKTHTEKLVSKQCTLIVAKNVLSGETKYFLSNRVSGRLGWSLRKLLRVGFGRWPVEDCFREGKEELGLDHFECRGWRCIHRHFFVVILSHLFCARVRQQLSTSEDILSSQRLTTEQVRRALSLFLRAAPLPRRCRNAMYCGEESRKTYYQRRNALASKSHCKTRKRRLLELGIDPDKIKSADVKPPK